MILSVTGGFGCGKSTVVKLLAKYGWRHIDSDALVRDDVLIRADVVAMLRAHFGNGIIGADGLVDRSRLGSIVFSDDGERHWLEQLVHPLVFERWRLLLGSDPFARWVVEVPLLFEKQLENWFDFIVCVTCAPAQQLTRLEQRGLTRAHAAQRISKQLPLARKIVLSDFVLLNDGSPEFLQKQIDLLVDTLSVVS
jgi:dephospho-CoA kinase